LLNDDFPFGDNDEKCMLEQQLARNYRYYNTRLSDTAKKVIDLHLEPDPHKRPTMDRIFELDWFDPDNWIPGDR